MRIPRILTVAILAVALTATAWADEGLGGKHSKRSMTAAASSLTVLSGPVTTQALGTMGDTGVTYTKIADMTVGDQTIEVDPSIDYTLGAAYGIMEGLEGGAMVPLALNNDRDLLGNPTVFATYAMDQGSFDVGGRVAFTLPVTEGSDPAVNVGVPVLFRFGDSRLDAGIFVPLTLGDEVGKSLYVPVRFTQSVTGAIFAGVETAIMLPDFKADAGSVPMSVVGGYSLLTGGNVIDVTFNVGFPGFISLAEGAENPGTDLMQIALGSNIQMAF